jgi:hypothetical protein
MKKILAFLIAGLLCSQSLAQIKTSTTEKKALLGVTSPVIQGNRILVGADSNVAVSPVVILTVETAFKFKRLKAYRNGLRIEPEVLSETDYLFAGAGKYRCEITAFDPEKGIDDSEVTFEIGGIPQPPKPEPDPQPEPDPKPPAEPFDSLAARVAAIAATMQQQEKTKYSSALQTVVAKMQAKEFRTLDQVTRYLQSQVLVNLSLNALLEDDAKARSLSFNEALAWYGEVLKGVR